MYNIPPTTVILSQGVGNRPARLPAGAFGGNTDFMDTGVPRTGTAALYGFVLNKGIGAGLLGTASFTATYGR